MSRSLTNFLLFETIYDDIPPINSSIHSFANRILSPTLRIISEDCDTNLGRVITLGQDAVGTISLFTYGTFQYATVGGSVEETIQEGDTLTESKVTALLTNQTTVATRSVSTCTAVGGICRKCVYGSNTDAYPTLEDVPAVGTSFQVESPTKRNFLTFLTNTHVGGFMGFKAIETEGDAILPVREELVRLSIREGELSRVFREVAKIPSVDQQMLEYARGMDDKLQKALLLILMYGIFINVQL